MGCVHQARNIYADVREILEAGWWPEVNVIVEYGGDHVLDQTVNQVAINDSTKSSVLQNKLSDSPKSPKFWSKIGWATVAAVVVGLLLELGLVDGSDYA